MKDYIRIHTTKEKIITLWSFARLAELLHEQKFSRVHRSFVVAMDKIDHIEKNRIRIGDQNIPISDTYADAFFKKLGGLWEEQVIRGQKVCLESVDWSRTFKKLFTRGILHVDE